MDREKMIAALPLAERMDVLRMQGNTERLADKKAPESQGRCKIDGENLTARHGIAPKPGTEQIADNGVDTTGICPKCGTRAKLSVKGKIGAHVVRGETLPASPALAEPNIDPTDTGSRVGDPETRSRMRALEIDGAYARGTVSIKTTSAKGGVETVDVPATVENLRRALDQARVRKPRSAVAKAAQSKDMARLLRQVRAAEAGTDVYEAPRQRSEKGLSAPVEGVARAGRTAGQRGEGRIDGVALVRGRDEGTRTHEQWLASRERRGDKPGLTTMDQPLGRERPDRSITGPTGPVEVPLTPTQRRNRQRRDSRKRLWAAAQEARPVSRSGSESALAAAFRARG